LKNAQGNAARAQVGSKTAKQLRVAGLFWKMRSKSMLLKNDGIRAEQKVRTRNRASGKVLVMLQPSYFSVMVAAGGYYKRVL